MNPLSSYTDGELLAELGRRMNLARERAEAYGKELWCEDCIFYAVWDDQFGRRKMPETYNPCTKTHKMDFRMPDSPIDDEFGFYRRGCTDRVERD